MFILSKIFWKVSFSPRTSKEMPVEFLKKINEILLGLKMLFFLLSDVYIVCEESGKHYLKHVFERLHRLDGEKLSRISHFISRIFSLFKILPTD